MSRGKIPHFRLTCVAQKRRCLSSLLLNGSFLLCPLTFVVMNFMEAIVEKCQLTSIPIWEFLTKRAFHSRDVQIYCNKRKFVHKKGLTSIGLVLGTNMAAVSLFGKPMANVTSCEDCTIHVLLQQRLPALESIIDVIFLSQLIFCSVR